MNNKYDSFAEAENKLQTMASPGIRPGLARLARLLQKAGMPQSKFPAVHIAGTNGKGSTAAGLYSILRASGYKTALYTSPHLVSFGERLEINGEKATAGEWLEAADKISSIVRSDQFLSSDLPTYFELVTAAAIMILADRKPDIAVFEAGMGGRLDASNILKDIALSLIVPIGIDHTEYLGSTLPLIAAEKFAILRRGVPALFMGGDEEINSLFRDSAAVHGAVPHIFAECFSISDKAYSLSGTDFTLTDKSSGAVMRLHTPLIGTFQSENAALSCAAALILKNRFGRITPENIKDGLSATKWPGRMEVVSKDPLIMIDGGHNAHAAKRLAETIETVLPEQRINIVIAMMKDKDISDALKILKRLDAVLYCTEVPGNPRSLCAEAMEELAERCGLSSAGVFKDPAEAVRAAACKGAVPVLCCGSLFLVGYLKENLNGI